MPPRGMPPSAPTADRASAESKSQSMEWLRLAVDGNARSSRGYNSGGSSSAPPTHVCSRSPGPSTAPSSA
eukprot:4408929-Pleurochrysis_carterae.AAC.1